MKVVERPPRGKSRKAKAPRRRVEERPARQKSAESKGERRKEGGFLFEDPYWDDAFCSYYDPTLGTCCRR
jgi:hypothetical protein